MDERLKFWKIRAANYDKLFWSKDTSYLDTIVKCASFSDNDLVLDVGCGTGLVARAIQPYVRHVVGIDISDAMLSKGKWENISLVKCDISNNIFRNNLFDAITARMVLHHILDDLKRVFRRCYELLKYGGKLIIAEGIPPSDEEEVVHWYSEMFKLKENRRIFTSHDIATYMKNNGFVETTEMVYICGKFSVKNWLINAGLNTQTQKQIMAMHVNASPKVKEIYRMRLEDNDCFIRTKNVITVGIRPIEK